MIVMSVEIRIPELGESVQEVEIVQWRKRTGDAVRRDEDLVQIDSAKAALDIPSPATGTLQEILKPDGEICNVGDVIGIIEESQEAAESPSERVKPDQEPRKEPEPGEAKEVSGAEPVGGPAKKIRWRKREGDEAERTSRPAPESGAASTQAEPARRERPRPEPLPPQPAEEHDSAAELETWKGSTQATGDGEPQREEELVPMSVIRRHIARRLVQAQHEAALLTTFNEADMSAVNQLRQKYGKRFQEKYGVKLGLMSFFAKATTESLKRFPPLNAEIRERHVVFRNYCDLGIAVGTGKGLVVPVLRNADRMSFAEIETAIRDLAQRAEQGALHPDELEGGTFTISNGGIYGSLLSTPIVNPPQSGILGLHAIQERPVARSGEMLIRPMMYLALTYDHRIVDGREAVSFLTSIKERVEDPASTLLEL